MSLVTKFGLTELEANQHKPSSTYETIFANRVRWARLYLKKANLLKDPQRSYTQITSDGLKLLEKKPEKIDNEYLKQFPSFLEFYTKKKQTTQEPIVTKVKSPEDMIIDGITEIRQNQEIEILDKIKQNPPDFFEKLVVSLLEKMGYGDGTPTGKSGDGGIDGMIKQDTLGLNEIYLQAKRWDGTVPAKEIRDFAGSLLAKKSKKGIFITTSELESLY